MIYVLIERQLDDDKVPFSDGSSAVVKRTLAAASVDQAIDALQWENPALGVFPRIDEERRVVHDLFRLTPIKHPDWEGLKKVRLQFDFSLDAVGELDTLREKLKVARRVDIVKHALGLLQWAVQYHEDGWTLLVERGDDQRVVELPGFSRESEDRGDDDSDSAEP